MSISPDKIIIIKAFVIIIQIGSRNYNENKSGYKRKEK